MIFKNKKIHFIGIGGAGMSGIAKILLQLEARITGSDIKQSDTTRKLQDLGASIYINHAAQNIEGDVELVVYSSAISQDNPEVVEAKKRNLPIIHRAEMLAQIMALQQSIAVAGAHGKTTTTAMISLMLEKNNLDPTIVIGGSLKQINGNAKLGKGDYLVAEADESDGSFLKLFPKMAVITNIENDHLDYYRSVSNIINAFVTFIKQIPQDGFAVICLDDKELVKIASEIPGNYVSYAIENKEADYTVQNISFTGVKSKCDVFYKGQKLGKLELQVPGVHNIANALAAIAIGMQVGLSFEQAAQGLIHFSGVKRRFELIDNVNGVTIVDDYAHHPAELKATLKAARNSDFQRVIAVFQPHRYSRTKLLQFEFGESFGDADLIVINEIYGASEKPIPGVSGQLIVNAILNSNKNNDEVMYCKTEDEIVNYLLDEVKQGDLVITMGAGNIWSAGVRLAQELKKQTEVAE